PGAERPCSVILTGTAGDGKSHLCGKIWSGFSGDEAEWAKDDVYHLREVSLGGKAVSVHVIRDLTALPATDPHSRYRDKAEFLASFCAKPFAPSAAVVSLIAGNDGQFMETLHRLPESAEVARVRSLVETLLVEDRRDAEGVPLKLFNLSRIPCR